MTDTWFAFRAYGSETRYGWGSEEEASAYVDHLNRGREINMYHYVDLSEDEVADLKETDGVDLEAAGINLDDELIAIRDNDDDA